MQSKFEGALKIFLKKSFEDKEGTTVEYNVCYFVDRDETEVLQINTKQDFSKQLDELGIATIEISDGRKPRLISFETQ